MTDFRETEILVDLPERRKFTVTKDDGTVTEYEETFSYSQGWFFKEIVKSNENNEN